MVAMVAVVAFAIAGTASAETWRGLTVAPEYRCSAYDKKADYPYPQSVEREIVRELGAVYGPYTGTCFSSTRQTDIEHIVAASEAHDSGLCAADRATRKRFAKDLRNLTLASPKVNRHQKSGKDAGEWIPDRNRCWFAGRVLEVKLRLRAHRGPAGGGSARTGPSRVREHGQWSRWCVRAAANANQGDTGNRRRTGGDDVLDRYDDNRNGRITCKEARRHGIAPVPRARTPRTGTCDGDGDGVVCE